MADTTSLQNRIDAEFQAAEQKMKEFQAEQVHAYQDRQHRLELFEQACRQMRDTWYSRLEALAAKFGDKVQLTPSITPSRREATFQFRSPLADIVLRLTASVDEDVRKLVLDYDLHILPILMKFEPHARIEFPLESIDTDAAGKWIDDRIIDFVKTYLSLHQNEYYLKDHMVVDPISGTRFPKYAAAAVLDWEGTKYYFVGEETRREFAARHSIAS